MADLTQLSDAQLTQLHAITQNESRGAPDSSTIKSSVGASGSMQVMPASAVNPGYGVTPSNGTPEDTARVGQDYYLAMNDKYQDPTMAAMAYNWGPGNVDRWRASGGDLSKVPDETLKYMHNFNKQTQGGGNPNYTGPATPKPDDLSSMSDADLMALYSKGGDTKEAPEQPGVLDNIGNWASGLGQAAAHIGSSMAGQAIGGLHGLADLATGRSEFATHDINADQNALTYQPRTPEGKQLSGYADKAMDFVGNKIPEIMAPLMAQGIANQTGYTKPITPDDLDNMKTLAQAAMTVEPLAHLGKAGGAAIGDAAAASELDKLNAPTAPAPVDSAMGPNAGPQRQVAQGDLFPDTLQNPEGQASSINPNALSEDVQQPISVGKNLRQQSLDFDPLETPDSLVADSNGVTSTPDVMEGIKPFRDATDERIAALNKMEPEQLSLLDDPAVAGQMTEEAPRGLTKDEYTQTIQNLAEKDGTRFPMPDDLDKAYDHYLDTTHDGQGGLFDGPTMAKNFAEGAAKESLERRVADHPTVIANQARVDSLQARIDNNTNRVPQAARDALTQAKNTLEKSKENIGKALGRDPTLPWEKDGTVNMFTFGNIPEMFKSMKAVLQAVHGVVFRTIDRLIPKQRSLDSTGQIFTQGMKDYANRQATRDWSQTVNEKPQAVLKGVDGLRQGIKELNPYESQSISPEEIKAQIQAAPDTSPGGKLRQNLLQGGQQLADYTRNPLVKYVTETVDRAMRDSQQFVRQQLMGKDGLREKIRGLSDDQLASIWHERQLNEGVRELSDSELKAKGYNDKQIDYYRKANEMQKANLDDLNRGRAQAGLPPIEARVAHIAGYFMGDFKRLITDADGKVVAVIAHNYRNAVETISKRFIETHPEGASLKMEPIKLNKLKEDSTGSDHRYQGYMNILNDLKDTNADVARVMDAYKDYTMKDAANAMKNRAAFKSKEGVIGAEGRKSWESAKENAKKGATQELQSMATINKWANMQDALSKTSKMMSDETIDKPNAKADAQAYLDNVQHRNQGPLAYAANSLVNSMAEATGVGPSVFRGISNTTKSGLLTLFIGMGKLSHSFVTLIQPLQAIPVVNSLLKARGADLGVGQLSAVGKSLKSQMDILQSLGKGGSVSDPFLRKALDYAKDNDTFNTSQFQFGHLTDIKQSRAMENLTHMAEFNVTGAETATRSFTYMYYAHMLKDLGLSDSEAIGTAHNAMRKVMVDYASHERPGVFGKLGFLGDLSAMLTRYKFNQTGQMAMALKEAGQGHVMPLLTTMLTGLTASGLRGFMGYQVANQLVQGVSTWMAKNNMIDKPTSIDEMLLHMLHGVSQPFRDVLNFGAPAALGIDMTGSLSHADDIPNDMFGTLVPQVKPVQDMVSSAYNVIHNPTKATAKAAIHDLSPNSIKGIEENAMFTDKDGNYMNPHTGELQAKRSKADQIKRDLGFRPVRQSDDALTTQVAQDAGKAEADVRGDALKKLTQRYDSGSMRPQDVQSTAKKYLANEGDPTEILRALQTHALNQHLTPIQRQQGIPSGTLSSIYRYNRTEELK